MVNGGDLIPVMNAAIIATEAHRVGGSLPSPERLREIRKAAWERYKNGSDIPYCEDAA